MMHAPAPLRSAALAGGLGLALTALVLARSDDPPREKPAAEQLPVQHKVETYRSAAGDIVFVLRLEQPFLAEEFEKSNYLRLRPRDEHAYLIYPSETRFHQKHAEFYGRLRARPGAVAAKVRLTMEMVSENLDGSRRIVQRQGEIEIPIPAKEGGPAGLLKAWAEQQNASFLGLLRYYPQDSFSQYVVLQSRARYGVTPPDFEAPVLKESDREASLYDAFTPSQAVQEALQRYALRAGGRGGDLNLPISSLHPPNLSTLPYEGLLLNKKEQGVLPQVADITKLVPAEYYFLHFNSMDAAGSFLDLVTEWGDGFLRLVTLQSRDGGLQEKLEDQLCVRRGPLTRLFADAVIKEIAITGSDPFVVEGADVTLLLKLDKPELFEKVAEGWLEEVKKKIPGVEEREFNYRGHRIRARYTEDRRVSSFYVRLGEHAVLSSSHRAVRQIVDTATGIGRRLFDALDYRYVSTLLPPSADRRSGYLFASEEFVKRQVGPAVKVSEKRRVECFNKLVLLNNASLFYRMEQGSSPRTITDLVEGRYVEPQLLHCPQGGAYSWDTRRDSCTCSVHNRLRYLTPNLEAPPVAVSDQERQEYERFKQRYQAFWQGLHDPIAVRITVGQRVRLESAILPFANGGLYHEVQSMVAGKPLPLRTANIAPSAVASLVAVRGRQANAAFLRELPGVPDVLESDPTLADLSWVGDRLAVHFCDDDAVLQIDPTQLKPLDVLGAKADMAQQAVIGLGLTAMKMPLYLTLDVEDRDKAARLLEKLAGQLVLKKGNIFTLPTTLDAYRLPDYKGHAVYVLSYQLYALKIRLHVALVGDQLVAASKAKTLHEVIEAAGAQQEGKSPEAHVLLRFNRKALNRLTGDLQLFWEEKARNACHTNIMPLYTLAKLYGVPLDEANRLAEAKYGVRLYCPDGGTYRYDAARDQVVCSVHGNRQHSRQDPAAGSPSFARLLDRLVDVTGTLRFEREGAIATIEINRNVAK